MNIYKKIDKKIRLMSRKRSSLKATKHFMEFRTGQGLPIVRLNKEQKEQVREAWNGYVGNDGIGTHELVLSATGKFDPYICSGLLYQSHLELKLNNSAMKNGFSDKNYFDMMFPDAPMPKTVIRNINGTLLDEQYRPLTEAEALRIMGKHEKLIAKPSMENGGGRGIKFFQNEEFSLIGKEMHHDYIVQEILDQYPDLAALNPTSINTLRVISLSLNGRISPVNCILRCGAPGAVTDNYSPKDGRGRLIIGVDDNGVLRNEAFFPCGEKLDMVTPNGARFGGLQLPNYKETVELTKRIHERLPHFGIIGFDICFEKDGSPRIIEFNVRSLGILYYQYVNGPYFGDRTQEIIDAFCK